MLEPSEQFGQFSSDAWQSLILSGESLAALIIIAPIEVPTFSEEALIENILLQSGSSARIC